ncbi:MAG: hypothetical protein RMA76_21010 [Deltaproteobacteria bacterium]|jgi:hypothetical protein
MSTLVPEGLLTIALWAAVALSSVSTLFLLVVLVREWKDGTLW